MARRNTRNNEAPKNAWRVALDHKGWTVERLAAETGYSLTCVGVALREPRLASSALRSRLAEVLGVEAHS